MRLVHISDFHIGQVGEETRQAIWLTRLVADLAEQCSVVSADGLVIGGDLGWGSSRATALSDQYDQATAVLRQLVAAAGVPHKSLMVAAGNHDIERPAISEFLRLILQKASGLNARDRDRYLSGAEVKAELTTSLGPFMNFYQACEEDSELGKYIVPLTPGTLGGSSMLLEGDVSLAVATLNSAWSSLGDDDDGSLFVSRMQFDSALLSIEEMSGAPVRVVAMHHPVDWLYRQNATDLRSRMNAEYQLALFGHEHAAHWSSYEDLQIHTAPAAYEPDDESYGYVIFDFVESEDAIDVKATVRMAGGPSQGRFAETNSDTRKLKRPQATISAQASSRATSSPAAMITSVVVESDVASTLRNLERSLDGRYVPALDPPDNGFTVFWPVRLRKPGPIHAAQAFAAAALSAAGAPCELWIDDLGTPDVSDPAKMTVKLRNWFRHAKGDESLLSVHLFSEVVEPEYSAIGWAAVREWWRLDDTNVGEVLAVTKQFEPNVDGRDVDVLLKRKARRFMSPAMLWTCLEATRQRRGPTSIVTLGGFDERRLWEIWSDRTKAPGNSTTGHFYMPQLNVAAGQVPAHMERTHLSWEGPQDIQRFFEELPDEPAVMHKAASVWFWNCCVWLPSTLRAVDPPVARDAVGVDLAGALAQILVP